MVNDAVLSASEVSIGARAARLFHAYADDEKPVLAILG